jgi:hypothetical protein
MVNAHDFRLWKRYQPAGAAAGIGSELAVPEPGSIALGLLGAIVVAAAAGRRRGK